uniref:Uncharacterized protein n=1 Tax=Anguilla anguilla TaxID=7936 RepID=A0A0E9QBD9_ANGAN
MEQSCKLNNQNCHNAGMRQLFKQVLIQQALKTGAYFIVTTLS